MGVLFISTLSRNLPPRMLAPSFLTQTDWSPHMTLFPPPRNSLHCLPELVLLFPASHDFFVLGSILILLEFIFKHLCNKVCLGGTPFTLLLKINMFISAPDGISNPETWSYHSTYPVLQLPSEKIEKVMEPSTAVIWKCVKCWDSNTFSFRLCINTLAPSAPGYNNWDECFVPIFRVSQCD